jgi:hypothetical protein
MTTYREVVRLIAMESALLKIKQQAMVAKARATYQAPKKEPQKIFLAYLTLYYTPDLCGLLKWRGEGNIMITFDRIYISTSNRFQPYVTITTTLGASENGQFLKVCKEYTTVVSDGYKSFNYYKTVGNLLELVVLDRTILENGLDEEHNQVMEKWYRELTSSDGSSANFASDE